MTSLISARNLSFVLDEMLDLEGLARLPRFSAHDRASFGQVLDLAERLARDHLAPSFATLDANEPRMENGRVVVPPELAAALGELRRAGMFGATAAIDHGGMGLPQTVASAAMLWLQAGNISVANYVMLTTMAAELLAAHASEAQKRRYMRPMIEGRFFGTMALSEPQAGSSLGDIATIARPLGEGRYAIRGTKMWISGGEHDMAETIVHLMLARIEGAPPGTRGLSLFIVPRHRLDDQGRPQAWNNIALAGLNHKMGQRGTVNTVLNVGEGGDTIGEIIGAPGQGLTQMFTMMNEARIAVSMGAVAHASAGYLHALAYARERLQGRHPDNKDPTSPQLPLTAHADVRRMLLELRIAAEGGIALGLTCARLADDKVAAVEERQREEASLVLELLTPIFKAFFSDEMVHASSVAMQVLGGAGYTRDHPLEQHYRDNRLNPIHEGTNGIQAIDLLGRKVGLAQGRALEALKKRIWRTAGAANAFPRLQRLQIALWRQVVTLDRATRRLDEIGRSKGLRVKLAHASTYMELAGTVVLAWIWLDQAVAAARGQAKGAASDRDFYEGKIRAAEYLFEQRLPIVDHLERLLANDAPQILAIEDPLLG